MVFQSVTKYSPFPPILGARESKRSKHCTIALGVAVLAQVDIYVGNAGRDPKAWIFVEGMNFPVPRRTLGYLAWAQLTTTLFHVEQDTHIAHLDPRCACTKQKDKWIPVKVGDPNIVRTQVLNANLNDILNWRVRFDDYNLTILSSETDCHLTNISCVDNQLSSPVPVQPSHDHRDHDGDHCKNQSYHRQYGPRREQLTP